MTLWNCTVTLCDFSSHAYCQVWHPKPWRVINTEIAPQLTDSALWHHSCPHYLNKCRYWSRTAPPCCPKSWSPVTRVVSLCAWTRTCPACLFCRTSWRSVLLSGSRTQWTCHAGLPTQMRKCQQGKKAVLLALFLFWLQIWGQKRPRIKFLFTTPLFTWAWQKVLTTF